MYQSFDKGELFQSRDEFYIPVISPSAPIGKKNALTIFIYPAPIDMWTSLRQSNYTLYKEKKQEIEILPCGCPSHQLKSFPQPKPLQVAGEPAPQQTASSELAHWPVQIRLIPPTAPYLKGADLLVAADCTPVAYPNFHQDFLRGKAVMVGCPKFDDAQAYIQKFSDIFNTADIKSVTVVVMEVPCCHGLLQLAQDAVDQAGRKVPIKSKVVSLQGQILNEEWV